MTMKEQERAEFKIIFNDIESLNGVYILETNFEHCYITFVYDGLLYYMQASAYYPFTDENYPGKWNYNVSQIDGVNTRSQISYYTAYTGIDSLHNWKRYKPLTHGQKIDVLLNNYERVVNNVVKRYGGIREKTILENGAFMAKGDTWNEYHKVIEVLSIKADRDGYRSGFQVDCVTGCICG